MERENYEVSSSASNRKVGDTGRSSNSTGTGQWFLVLARCAFQNLGGKAAGQGSICGLGPLEGKKFQFLEADEELYTASIDRSVCPSLPVWSLQL